MPKDAPDEKKKKKKSDAPAATPAYGLSPTLTRAKSCKYPTPLPRWLRFVAWTLALWVPACFYLGPLLLVLPPFLYLWSPRAALALVAVDVLLATWPNREWPWFRGVFELWYEHFDMHHNLIVDPTDPSAPVKMSDRMLNTLTILAMHPHGIIPIQGFLWPALADQYMTRGQPLNPTGSPGLYGFGATTDAALRLPLLRQVLRWLTAGSAHRDVLRKGLESGRNLYILPGGVAEIFVSEPGRHAVLARRHGLMKLALRTGACVVPMYVFGGTDFYEHLATYNPNRGGSSGGGGGVASLVGPLLMRLSRGLKAGFTLFWGQFGLPMPFAVEKCCMVMGDPIAPVPDTAPPNGHPNGGGSGVGAAEAHAAHPWSLGGRKTCRPVPEPTDEQVEELLGRYTDALRRLFDQYKAQAGCPDAQLEFVD
jgi:hypothetical protein